ncbi:uncharacterized protein LOC108699358 isoform X2 [Xenopus laevis]|uniref:Ig-like domain-containing protein n=2 Tax=Xenopus laevis TaxID=8355 RepID=A0A974CA20_XENLA|nr:uncharacterized protein LOC108699358 isoform X2 [Xenopus laevis]OCT69087.1 hypothetical protein XELAEV_18040396mg [Xenopus laevis]
MDNPPKPIALLFVFLWTPICGSVKSNTLQVAVSSDIELCGLTCAQYGIYTLDRLPDVPILDFACADASYKIYGAYRERLLLNVSSGCCTIRAAQKNDRSEYELKFMGMDKKLRLVQRTQCWIMEPVSVTNITTNRSGENVSLRVSYSGEETTVLWTWNGGALPERHQLSDSNKTLTVPSTDTGTFTVLVSNPVSHTSTHYNLTLPDAEFASRSHAVAAAMIIAAVSLAFAAAIFICCQTARTSGPGGTIIHTT